MLTSRRSLLIALGIAIAAGGCTLTKQRTARQLKGGDAEPASGAVPASPSEAAVTRIAGPLRYPDGFVSGRIPPAGNPPEPPADCDAIRAVRQIEALFRAVSNGDSTLVSRFFPVGQPDQFVLYRLGGPGPHGFGTSDISALQGHFRLRFAAAERIELRGIQVNRWDDGLAHFGPLLAARSASDLPSGVRVVTGKGAVNCKTGKFVVLNLVTDPDRLPYVQTPATDR
jgi:hypothetical protein